MARKPSFTSILQFDAHTISVLRCKTAGKGRTAAVFHHIAGEWGDPEVLSEALKNFIQTHDLVEDHVYLILPRYDITTRIVRLPSKDPREIEGMVKFSAEKYVPYSLEEMVVDQCILSELDSGESDVLIALAHHEGVDRNLELLRKAGVVPEKMLLSTACIYSAALAAGSDLPDRYALVNLSSGGIEITVISQGRPVFTRGIATVQDWESIAKNPEADAGAGILDINGTDELATELRGTLSAYRRESEDGLEVECVYLACAYAQVDVLCEALSAKINRECKPASFILSLLDTQESPLPGLPLEAVGGILESQGETSFTINLLPERETQARRLESAKQITVRAAAMVFLILCCLGAYYFQAASQRNRYINELQQRIATIEPNAVGITEKREQLNILHRQVDRKGSVVEQLARLVEAAPDDRINFSRLTLRRNEGIDLWGRARTVNDVAQFTQNIRNLAEAHLSFFARARSLYEQQTMERNESVFSYQIEVSALEEEDAE